MDDNELTRSGAAHRRNTVEVDKLERAGQETGQGEREGQEKDQVEGEGQEKGQREREWTTTSCPG